MQMGIETKIQWTDHTFNPWRGCTKIAPGCANCYADSQSKRNPGVLGVWGPNGTRVVASESYWQQPYKWNRKAKAAGVRARVFCASLADVFEDWQGSILDSQGRTMHRASDWKVSDREWIPVEGVSIGRSQIRMDDVRDRLFRLIDATPWLDWQLVTKRPENVRKMWPGRVVDDSPPGAYHAKTASECSIGVCHSVEMHRSNVWLLTSISDQATADAMIPKLLECRDLCPVLGISAEPLLGRVDLSEDIPKPCTYCAEQAPDWETNVVECRQCDSTGLDTRHPCIDWVIIGGESGPDARPCRVQWIRDLVAQCKEAEVAAFVKQLGQTPYGTESDQQYPFNHGQVRLPHGVMPEGESVIVLVDKKGGDPSEWPADLKVRQFPHTGA
jgi:protein gp37